MKVRHYLRAPGRHCLRTRAHGRRRLNGVPMVLEEEEEEESDLDEAEEVEEVALAVEHVECSGRWWATVGPDGAAVLRARCG